MDRRLAATLTTVLAGLVVACSESTPGDPPPPTEDGGGGGAGGATTQCAPGEEPLGDGSCVPAGANAGVPPEACAPGFEAADGGCRALLPSGTCSDGQMALPGETQCREVADCGSSAWANVPVEATTEFVDGSFTGPSDGTQALPWSRVQDGIDAAAPGAIVAVTDGVYVEQASIAGKAVRLWGRCPRRVELLGVSVGAGAAGTEIRGVAVALGFVGVQIDGAMDVAIDRAWIHDTVDTGVEVSGASALASAVVSASLLERTAGTALFSYSGDLTVDGCVIRDTQPEAGTQKYGRGLNVRTEPTAGRRATMTVRGSVIEQSRDMAAYASAADLTIEGTLLRDTTEQASDGTHGFGIYMQPDLTTRERPSLVLRSSVLERHLHLGMALYGGDADVALSVVRDTRPLTGMAESGIGVLVRDADFAGEPANAIITTSLIEQSRSSGVFVEGSGLTLDRVIVRDTMPAQSDQRLGRGIIAQPSATTPVRTSLVVRGSLVERSHEAGIFVAGADVLVETTRVQDTMPRALDGFAGRGLLLQLDPTTGTPTSATLRWCAVERSFEAGIFVGGAEFDIEGTAVRDTSPSQMDGLSGRGISLEVYVSTLRQSIGSIRSSAVERSHDVGIALFGSQLELEGSVVTGTMPLSSGHGDGLAAVWFQGATASVDIRRTRIEASSRAGIASFGGSVTVGNSVLECNAIQLNGEDSGVPYQFTDVGANACGCGDVSEVCKVLSAALEPPAALPP